MQSRKLNNGKRKIIQKIIKTMKKRELRHFKAKIKNIYILENVDLMRALVNFSTYL